VAIVWRALNEVRRKVPTGSESCGGSLGGHLRGRRARDRAGGV